MAINKLLSTSRLWHMRCTIAHTCLYTRLKHWRHTKKTRLVWLKKLWGMQQITRLKQQSFLSFPFYQTQRSYEKIICICLLFYWFIGENGIIRSSHLRHSIKEGILKNVVKFTGKHLCQGVFLINLQVLMTSLLIPLTCTNLSLFFLMQDNFLLNKEFIFKCFYHNI